MATLLKNIKLTSVDLVRAGANQEADICLFKSLSPPDNKPSDNTDIPASQFDVIEEIDVINEI